MLHIDKLQDLCVISLPLEIFCTHRIRDKSCHSLFDQSVRKQRCKCFICNLTVHFMLTARNRKNDLRFPANCFCKCKIGSSIAGMQRHDHIHFIRAGIICNISFHKLQFSIAIFFCKLVACINDIRLQIQSDDPDIITF